MAPFWRAEERNRSFHLSHRIGSLLETAEALFEKRDGASELIELLEKRHCMEEAAAVELVSLLERQRAETGAPLPHRHHLLLERVEGQTGTDGRRPRATIPASCSAPPRG